MIKAVGLFSGGLDSALAMRLIRDLGIEVDALHFYTTFVSPQRKGEVDRTDEIRRRAASLGITLTLVDATEEFLEMIRRPRFGYGSGVNPCLDCRIVTLKKAKARMEAVGAQFVFTGEVLGQRPMTQRRDTLRLVERESGLEGLLLRPLSAQLLPPTVPEQEGGVDRARLLDLSGRSRKPQIELARQWGITDYPQPAGGCFLTDKTLARRIKDVLSHTDALSKENLILSKVGRHFRLSDSVKVIVGRWEAENDFLERYAEGRWTFEVVGVPGPIALAEGDLSSEAILKVAALVARYSDAKGEASVQVRYTHEEREGTVEASPADDARIAGWRI
ncbi:MAG: thiamine biosynthesis protein [Candidatus Latescibacteria bacterium]|nr:thiamine biosynthesis protein [Candidatus Latescibacterota bacterium]